MYVVMGLIRNGLSLKMSNNYFQPNKVWSLPASHLCFNKIKLLWGHNPLNWLRFQWQLKSVQNGNNIIIVVAVVAVVVVRLFLFNCCGNYFSNIMDHKIFWSKNKFYPKKDLAQKRCWYNKMLGQKIKVQKKFWSSKILITKKFYPKSFEKIRSVTAEIILIWTNVTKTVLV